jgi:hypothetical protein
VKLQFGEKHVFLSEKNPIKGFCRKNHSSTSGTYGKHCKNDSEIIVKAAFVEFTENYEDFANNSKDAVQC